MIQCKNCLEWRTESYFNLTKINGRFYFKKSKCKLCSVTIKDPVRYKERIESLLIEIDSGGITLSNEDRIILEGFKKRGVIDYVECFILCRIYCDYFNVADKEEEFESVKEIERMWSKLVKLI